MTPHLSDETLRALLEGRAETFQAGAHLLACGPCQARFVELGPVAAVVLEKLRDLHPQAEQLESPGNVHLLADAQGEYQEALELAEGLAELAPLARRRAVERSGLPEVYVAAGILRTVPQLIQDRPGDVAALCELGIELLAPDHGAFEVNCQGTPSLLGELYAQLANALSVQERLLEAQPYMEEALVYAEQGADALSRGEIYKLASVLARDRRDFPEATRLARIARQSFEAVGRLRKTREIDFLEAILAYHQGRFEDTLEAMEELTRSPDGEIDPRLRFYAGTWRLKVLTLQGKFFEASAVLRKVEPLAKQFSGARVDAHMAWYRGLLLARTLGPNRGRVWLEKAKSYFLREGPLVEAALVTLDASMAHFEYGEFDEAARLAGSIVEVFAVTGRHHHALMALRQFHQAVEARARSLQDLYVSLHRYLPLAQRDPDYAYSQDAP